MKKLFFAIVIFSLFAFQPPKSKLEGTWKLVSFKSISNGEITSQMPGNFEGEQLKSWSGKHFIFVGQYKNGETIISNYGNGTYTLKGNHYEEHINIHTSKNWEGKTVKIFLEFKGDTLIQTNIANDDWSIDKNNCSIEKYIQVK